MKLISLEHNGKIMKQNYLSSFYSLFYPLCNVTTTVPEELYWRVPINLVSFCGFLVCNPWAKMVMYLTKMRSVFSLSATQSLRRNSFYRLQLFKEDFSISVRSVWFVFKGLYKETCLEDLHQSILRHFLFLAYPWFLLFVAFFPNMVFFILLSFFLLCLQPKETIWILLCHLMSARIVLNG